MSCSSFVFAPWLRLRNSASRGPEGPVIGTVGFVPASLIDAIEAGTGERKVVPGTSVHVGSAAEWVHEYCRGQGGGDLFEVLGPLSGSVLESPKLNKDTEALSLRQQPAIQFV